MNLSNRRKAVLPCDKSLKRKCRPDFRCCDLSAFSSRQVVTRPFGSRGSSCLSHSGSSRRRASPLLNRYRKRPDAAYLLGANKENERTDAAHSSENVSSLASWAGNRSGIRSVGETRFTKTCQTYEEIDLALGARQRKTNGGAVPRLPSVHDPRPTSCLTTTGTREEVHFSRVLSSCDSHWAPAATRFH